MRKIMLLTPLLALFSLFTFNAFGADITCSAGEFLSKDNKCETCRENYYCKGGTWTPDDKEHGLDKCPDDKPYSNSGAKSGSDCYAKTINCKAGYYVVKGENKCTICPIGSYCIGLKGASVDDTKDQGIEKCPNATPYSKSGSDNQSQCFDTVTCNAGEYLPASEYDKCDTCKPGFYCKGGKYPYSEKDDNGRESCSKDKPFSESGSDDATDCRASIACFPGTYLPQGSKVCLICPAGSWCGGGTFVFKDTLSQGIENCDKTKTPFSPKASTSASACSATISCPAGEFLPAKSIECKICPEGGWCPGDKSGFEYSNDKDQGLNWCSDGSSLPGATSEAECGVVCGEGHYWNGKDCDKCKPGYYCPRAVFDKSNSEVQGLIPCPSATPFTGEGAASVEKCEATLKCDEGQYLPKGERGCEKCKAGFYCDGKSGELSYNVNVDQGITQCDSKAPFSDEGTSDSSKCFDKITCSDGEYLPSGAKSCKKCLRGYYCDGKSSPYSFNANSDQGITQCDSKAPFSEAGTADGGKCFDKLTCDAGKYLPAGAQECAECTSGNYCEKRGDYEFDSSKAQGIESCPQDAPNSPAGSKDKGDCYANVTCNAGTYLSQKKDGTCSACGKGEYCPGGTFKSTDADGTGKNSCPKSDPNSDSGATSEDDCYLVECSAGEYLPKGGDKCESCPSGETCNGGKMKYSAKGNRGILISCNAGYYLPAGTEECEPCPAGSYCEGLSGVGFDEDNDQGIEKCPASRPLSYYYSQSSDNCNAYVDCNAGTYFPAGTLDRSCKTCLSGYYCPHGTYQYNATSNQGLTQCPGATPNSLPGATSQSACFSGTCAAGTYLPKGATVCATCPVGYWCGGGNYTFSDQIDQGAVQCDSATPFSEAGSDESTDCSAQIACIMGTYLPANSYVCETCLPGYYCNGTNSPFSFNANNSQGLTQCDAEAPLSNAGATSSSACFSSVTCNAGTYSNNGVCETCPENYYCAGGTFTTGGTNGLTQCDNNTPYSNTGATSSSDCFAGEQCQEGMYMPANSRGCEWCTENHYCPGGTYQQNQQNNQGIFDCPSATPYSWFGNSSSSNCFNRISCSAGTYLPVGASACVTCPANYYCYGIDDVQVGAAWDQGISSCAAEYAPYIYSDAGTNDSGQCYSTSGTDTCANLNPVEHGNATYANTSATYKTYRNTGLQLIPMNACDITGLSCDTGYTAQPAGPLSNVSYYTNMSNLSANTKIRQLNGDDLYNNASSLSNGEAELVWNNGTKVHVVASCASTNIMSSTDFLNITAQATNGTISLSEAYAMLWAENGPGVRAANVLSQGATGSECWLKFDSYTPAGGSAQTISTPVWKFADLWVNKEEDANAMCAAKCLNSLMNASDPVLFKAFFGDLAAQQYCKYSPIICEAGTYLPANSTDASACTTCTAGNYCEGGTFSTSASVQGLTPCPQNTPNSAIGATSEGACYASVTCPAGQYLPMGQLTCAPCTNGNYCLGGTFNSNVVADQGLTACDNATPFSPTGASAANACSAGVSCEAGTYLPANGAECVSCPAGSYCVGGVFGFNANAAQGITACDSATPLSPEGATSANACYTTVTCDAGYYLPANSLVCTPCAVGNYCLGGELNSNVSTASGLTACPNATPFSEEGASASNQCYANIICFTGTYLPANSLSCATCTANNYCLGGVFGYSTTSAQGLTACPQATPYAPAGSTGSSDCTAAAEIVCDAGTYLPANATACAPCTSGNYCIGGHFVQGASNQGIATCPTGYTSAAGTENEGFCYQTTTINCAQYNTGNESYRTGVAYANATAPGKTYYNGTTVLNTPGACAITAITCDSNKALNTNYTGPLANYTFYTPVSSNKWRSLNNNTSAACNSSNTSGLSKGEFEVTYIDNTKVKGLAQCYDKGDGYTSCSCTLKGYSIGNASMTAVTTVAQTQITRYTDESTCQCECPSVCANAFKDVARFADAFVPQFFGTLGVQLYCTSDISVDWYNGSEIFDSNTCTYKEDAKEPLTNPTREGYTFNGWVIDNN